MIIMDYRTDDIVYQKTSSVAAVTEYYDVVQKQTIFSPVLPPPGSETINHHVAFVFLFFFSTRPK